MFDIIAAGEILIDLVDTGNLQFSGTVGGAPCNALAQAAKLGSRTAFIDMVDDDAFGRVCASQLDKLGIDRTHLAVTSRADTTLAFVTLAENGDRDFTFYRRPGADTLLTVKNMPFSQIAQSRVYLFGGVAYHEIRPARPVFTHYSSWPALRYFELLIRICAPVYGRIWRKPRRLAERLWGFVIF